MSKASRNLRHLRTLKGWSQTQLADALKIPRARIGAYEEERCDPPIDVLIRLSDLFHIAIDAMVRCDLSSVRKEQLIKVGDNRILFPVIMDQDEEDMVEVLTVKASAGYLGGYADPDYIGKLQKMSLPFNPHGKCRAFPIKGDSMPPLQDGSYVIAKYVDSIKEVRSGHTYIILTKDDGIVYKRAYTNKPKQLELHSDNPHYKPFAVPYSDVLEIWEFVCSMNMSDKRYEGEEYANVLQLLQSINNKVEALKL
ncbi:MAG: LexA family transcriptional regulator [Saprospiraceae bacterium]|nr:LexA family transcriptional regulator [Saprospiraceae bacterium]